ncbi:RNA methyltransferase, TrmH family [Actinomyces ruminicola]|uniref:RNA methyltransferase, TrmH family n=1 Tax=Actinomyces ruminicola TaxID=332524 RepID=A0A1G9Z7E4_9ACTO|nr:RNA methyltransferase [Actinomyces ruminicola]SDN17057.1 RNA methyltransferase, TrmH family [Actinomyces ruminicola]
MSATAILDNPAATRITRVAGLARRSARDKHRRFAVEGPQGVREAVRHAADYVLDVYLTQEAARAHADIAEAAAAAGLYTHLVTPEVMAAMSADAQGVLAVVSTDAVVAPPESGDGGGGAEAAAPVTESDAAREADALAGAALEAALSGARLVAVLTETQDPGNAGTIIRAADAAGADAVVLLKGSVDPTNPKVVRATAGSLFHLPVLTGVTLEKATAALRAAGLRLLAADGHGTISLFDAEAELAAPSAWLLGNEARGLAPEALEAADTVVSIPIYGRAESLNVASAAAICLYASARVQDLG